MSISSSKEVGEIIANARKVLIVAHVRPDGDAVASVLGLQNALRESNRKADAFFPLPLTSVYNGLSTGFIFSDKKLPKISNYSHVISLDTSNSTRLGSGNAFTLDELEIPVINIDHHPDNEMFGTFNYVEESASTAELVQDIIPQIEGCTISPKTATLLMFGLVADTGAFRYDNTKPETMINGSELLKAGADYHSVINRSFFSKPLNYAQFEAELLVNHLKTEFDGRFAWFYIEPELIKKYSINLANAEGLIEVLRQLAGTEMVAIITKLSDAFKISLRSKNQSYSVGAIARQLNGGGHEMAAGCSIKTDDLTDAETQLLKLVAETFERD